MVQPTPFDRLLQEAVQLANRDPNAAFGRLDDLYGKSASETDVLALGAYAVHLGCAALGRYAETAHFQRRLLAHPAVADGSATMRSLWRGLAVVHRLADQPAEADAAIANGVADDAERCRLAIMSAQTYAARARHGEAVRELAACAGLIASLPEKDDLLNQAASIAGGLARLAEVQLRAARDLLLAASDCALAAWSRHPDWRPRHQALFQRGKALLLAADPTRALAVVQAMMALEDEHDAGPIERFHTAALACRAQLIRGQLKIAGGALEACRDFAKRVGGDTEKPVRAALDELEQAMAQARAA